jgi:hypothetical protein
MYPKLSMYVCDIDALQYVGYHLTKHILHASGVNVFDLVVQPLAVEISRPLLRFQLLELVSLTFLLTTCSFCKYLY